MYLETRENGSILHTFDSVSEYITFAQKGHSELPKSRRSSRKEDSAYRTFSGSATFDSAIELAYKGYPKAREHAEPFRNLVLESISPYLIKPKPRYDMVGEIVDQPRYLSGMPDPFLTRYEPLEGITTEGKTKRIYRILVNLTYICYTSADEILNRGAAIAALVDLLEEQGKRAEVIGVTHVKAFDANKIYLTNFIPIKDAGQPLDIDFIYFVLAHPAMLRRFAFSVWETYPQGIRERIGIPGGYGRPATPNDTIDSDLYFPEIIDTSAFGDQVKTKKWIISILRKEGAIDDSYVDA